MTYLITYTGVCTADPGFAGLSKYGILTFMLPVAKLDIVFLSFHSGRKHIGPTYLSFIPFM